MRQTDKHRHSVLEAHHMVQVVEGQTDASSWLCSPVQVGAGADGRTDGQTDSGWVAQTSSTWFR